MGNSKLNAAAGAGWIIAGWIVVSCLPGSVQAAPTFTVFCNGGQTLAHVLSVAPAGSTIRINGICNESVTITKHHITLDGRGVGVIDGTGTPPTPADFDAVVTVDGARGVTLKRLTVQDGPEMGVFVGGAATVQLDEVTVHGNGRAGIAVADGSTVTASNVSADENQTGFDVFSQGAMVLKGQVSASDNVGSGLDMGGASTIELRGAAVTANGNGAFGWIIGNSSVSVFGFPQSQGSSITVNENRACGLVIADADLTIFGAAFFGSGANVVTTNNNADCGIWLPSSGRLGAPFGTAKFIAEGNEDGIRFGENSAAVITGGLRLTNNDRGLVADAAGAIVLGSLPSNPSNIMGNVTDVELSFGSRVTFAGPPFVGVITCDASVLSRGSTMCP